MKARTIGTYSLLALAAVTAGCADGNNFLSTASVAPVKVAVAPKIDPACVALSNQIDTLRSEGSVERLEKAAAGKTSSVQVKRTALAKQAELNKANADFQMKCGPLIPKAQTAQVTAGATQPAPVMSTTSTAQAQQMKTSVTSAAQTAAQAPPKN